MYIKIKFFYTGFLGNQTKIDFWPTWAEKEAMGSWRRRVKERGVKEESLVVEWQNRNIGEEWGVLSTWMRENKEIVQGASKVFIFFFPASPAKHCLSLTKVFLFINLSQIFNIYLFINDFFFLNIIFKWVSMKNWRRLPIC